MGRFMLLVLVALPVCVHDTIDSYRDIRHSTMKQNREGMYQVKRGHWCQLCPAGTFLVKPCEHNRGPSVCNTCPDDQFIHYANHRSSCIYCTGCGIQRQLIQPCTRITDTECQCPSGKFWHVYKGNTGVCLTHKVCPKETLEKGTPYTDTVCGEFTSSPVSEPHSTTMTPTTSIGGSIHSTAGASTTTKSSINSTCESHQYQQSCETWFVMAMVELVIIFILMIVILCLWKGKICGKSVTNTQPDTELTEQSPALPINNTP